MRKCQGHHVIRNVLVYTNIARVLEHSVAKAKKATRRVNFFFCYSYVNIYGCLLLSELRKKPGSIHSLN